MELLKFDNYFHEMSPIHLTWVSWLQLAHMADNFTAISDPIV
jgi:hypothetical protein